MCSFNTAVLFGLDKGWIDQQVVKKWGLLLLSRTWLRPGTDVNEPRLPDFRRIPLSAVYIASQIVLFMVLFQLYKSVRKVSIPEPRYAFENAERLLDFQGALRLNFELDLQRWYLDLPDIFIQASNRIYAHYMIGFYVCAMLCLLLAPERYRYLRRVFFTSMVLALPWFYLFPLAPPRFLAEPHVPGFDVLRQYTFVDTLEIWGPIYFKEGGLVTANRYAAMPSMHCGWCMIGGFFVASFIPSKVWATIVVVFFSLMMGFTVMVTGNHYWSDVVVGWLVVAASFWVNRLLPYPLPIRWQFWNRDASLSRQPAS